MLEFPFFWGQNLNLGVHKFSTQNMLVFFLFLGVPLFSGIAQYSFDLTRNFSPSLLPVVMNVQILQWVTALPWLRSIMVNSGSVYQRSRTWTRSSSKPYLKRDFFNLRVCLDQGNCRCCYFQTPSVVHWMNATASAQSPKFLWNFYSLTIFANFCG